MAESEIVHTDGFEVFAVTAPRGVEHDEGVLAAIDDVIEIGRCQLLLGIGNAEKQRDGEDRANHLAWRAQNGVQNNVNFRQVVGLS